MNIIHIKSREEWTKAPAYETPAISWFSWAIAKAPRLEVLRDRSPSGLRASRSIAIAARFIGVGVMALCTLYAIYVWIVK